MKHQFTLLAFLLTLTFVSPLLFKFKLNENLLNNSTLNDTKIHKKLNNVSLSSRFVSYFLSQLTGDEFNQTALKILKNCKVFQKSKFVLYMNSRLKQVRENNKKFNKAGKNSEEDRKAASKMIRLGVLRLIKEYFENLSACREGLEKKTAKNFRELIKTINSVIWNRCQKNCALFKFESIIKSFEKFQTFKSQKNKTKLYKVLDNNAETLLSIFNEYSDANNSTTVTEPPKNATNANPPSPSDKETPNKKSNTISNSNESQNQSGKPTTEEESPKPKKASRKYQNKPEDFRLLI